MKRAIKRLLGRIAWRAIAERRQAELNEEHMRTRGYYVNNKHEFITI